MSLWAVSRYPFVGVDCTYLLERVKKGVKLSLAARKGQVTRRAASLFVVVTTHKERRRCKKAIDTKAQGEERENDKAEEGGLLPFLAPAGHDKEASLALPLVRNPGLL